MDDSTADSRRYGVDLMVFFSLLLPGVMLCFKSLFSSNKVSSLEIWNQVTVFFLIPLGFDFLVTLLLPLSDRFFLKKKGTQAATLKRPNTACRIMEF